VTSNLSLRLSPSLPEDKTKILHLTLDIWRHWSEKRLDHKTADDLLDTGREQKIRLWLKQSSSSRLINECEEENVFLLYEEN